MNIDQSHEYTELAMNTNSPGFSRLQYTNVMLDLDLLKGGMCIARLLGWSGGMPPKITNLLRSFLVYSWGEIAKIGRLTAKPSCCV